MIRNILFVLMALTLGACQTFSSSKQLYEVRMMSGDSLFAKSKPKLNDDGYYRFNDVNGQRYIINKDSVLFIEAQDYQR